MANNIKNILSIDVEDYFQINAFSDVINYNDWDSFESRVERNTIKILDLLEGSNPASSIQHPVSKPSKATFFVLGWIAERYPDLVKDIHNRGHEVACHGYAHQLIFKQDRDTFKDDVKKAKDILEDITGSEIIGYRAPTYTITKKTMWALEVLHELGFKYDSSIFPVTHDVYGYPGTPRFPYFVELNKNSKYEFIIKDENTDIDKNGKIILEFPISTYECLNKNIPVSGGGYFRLFPYMLTRYFLKRINEKEKKPFVFYLHPWEVDPEIPKMGEASALSKFRTYVNLDKTLDRLERLIRGFNFTCFADVI